MPRHGLRRETVELDKRIWEWSLSIPKVTKNMIQEHAKKLFLEAGILSFKASDGWYRRWRKRWKDGNLQKNSSKNIDKNLSNIGNNFVVKSMSPCVNTYNEDVGDANKNASEKLIDTHKDVSVSRNSGSFSKLNASNSCYETKIGVDSENCSNLINHVAGKEVVFELGDTSVPDSANSGNGVVDQRSKSNEMQSLEICLNPNKQFDKSDSGVSFNGNDNNNSSSLNGSNVISNGFQVPRFSLSNEIFDNYNLLENGDEIFCKNCGDFHVDDFRCDKFLFIDRGSNYNGVVNDSCSENFNLSRISESDLSQSLEHDSNLLLDNSDFNHNSDSVYNLPQNKENYGLSKLNSTVSVKTSDKPTGNSSILDSNNSLVISGNDYSNSNNTDDNNGTDLVSNNNSVDVLRTRKKGERYLPQFKSKVIAYAKMNSIKSTAYKFNVYEDTVSEWVHAKVRGQEENDLNVFQHPPEDVAENVFIKWLGQMRNEQRLLNHKMIKDKLCEIVDKLKNKRCLSKKVSWLNLYFERIQNTIVEGDMNERSSTQKKHIPYPVGFKMEVAMYAEKSSQQAAARVFCVARKRVFEWLEIMKTKGTIRSAEFQSASYVTDATVDKAIWSWYSSQADKPTSLEVREMGRKLYSEKGLKVTCSPGWFYRWRKRYQLSPVKSIDCLLLKWVLSELDKNQCISHLELLEHAMSLQHASSFKASRGWAIRFCKRYTSLLQKLPTIDTPLPPVMELNVAEFRRSIKELKINLQLELENIGTVDEIPIHFINSGVKKKELLIRRPGFDNCQASLVLTSLADGTMLPSILVLKGTTETSLPSTKNIFVFCRKDGCVDKDIMLFWLSNVWLRFQSGVSLLVTDRYTPHVDSSVRDVLCSSLCRHELFPCGCSCKLQPLGISLSNLFKEKIEKSWRKKVEWSSWNHDSPYLSIPSHVDILDWVAQAHQEIALSEKDELKEAFQKTLLAEYSEESVT